MSISISSALSTASLAAENASTGSTAAERLQPRTNQAPYKVELTSAQQVYNLYNQGQTVSQIASNLSLSVELVNNFLGINNPS